VTPIDRAFAPLIGLPCWQVTWDAQTGLWLEFGTPRLTIREPKAVIRAKSPRVRRLLSYRLVTPVGQWTFAVTSGRWRLTLRDEPRAVTSDGAPARIARLLTWLDGQQLTSAAVDDRTGRTTLMFDLGATLVIATSMVESGELWTLYQPRGRALSLRADGWYSAGLATQADRWRPLVTSAA
jgi:hypothetical protein